MFILASFLDPGNDGWDVGDASQQLLFLVALAGVLWAIVKWALLPAIHKMVVTEIAAATKPIQKDANGGYSLPDVARTTDWTREAIKVIATAQGVKLPPDRTSPGNHPDDRKA